MKNDFLEEIDQEINELLKNELFWLSNFSTTKKTDLFRSTTLTKEQINHNENQANSLKSNIEKKYPNIEIDLDYIKELGDKYSKWTKYSSSKKDIEAWEQNYKKEQEKFPDWISSGSVLDVQTWFRHNRRKEDVELQKCEFPKEDLRMLVIAGKVDPSNLDMNLIEYLRQRTMERKIY